MPGAWRFQLWASSPRRIGLSAHRQTYARLPGSLAVRGVGARPFRMGRPGARPDYRGRKRMSKASLRLLLALTLCATAAVLFGAASAKASGSQIPLAGPRSPQGGGLWPSASGFLRAGGVARVDGE